MDYSDESLGLRVRDSNTTRWRLAFRHDIILQVILVMLYAPIVLAIDALGVLHWPLLVLRHAPIVLRADAPFAISIADRALSATVDDRATIWTLDLNVFVISIIYGSWSEFNAIVRFISKRVATVRSTFQCHLWLW